MSTPRPNGPVPSLPRIRSAGQLTNLAAALDEHIRAASSLVEERSLHDARSDDQATLAEQLGHLAQSLRFHAGQLEDWAAGRRYVLGRPAAGDADELDATEAASRRGLPGLLAELDDATTELRAALGRLTDEHLEAWLFDVEVGRCPAPSFVAAVLAHAHGHAWQLADTAREAQVDDGSRRTRNGS